MVETFSYGEEHKMENNSLSKKKTYVAPALTEYGSLEKLTLTIGANPGDAGGSSAVMTCL
jgi:hypothetical protein